MFNSLTFMIHGGGDHGGGIAAALSALLGFIDKLTVLEPPDIFAALLPGIAAMQNIHPLLVHFPIAFLSMFFLLDLTGSLAKRPAWRNVASWLLYFGAAASIATATAGFIAAGSVPHGGDVHEIMENHEHFGITVVISALLLSAWRAFKGGIIEGPANTLFLLLAAIMCGIMTLGADLGGLMVYRYGVSVAAVPVTEEALLHSHDGNEAHEHEAAPASEPADGHASAPVPAVPKHTHTHDHDHDHDHDHQHAHPAASR